MAATRALSLLRAAFEYGFYAGPALRTSSALHALVVPGKIQRRQPINALVLGHSMIFWISAGKVVSQSGEMLRLHHGTDAESAIYIKNYGLSLEKINRISGADEFWMTMSSSVANDFAILKSQPGPPTLLSFDLPVKTINTCLARDWAELHMEDSIAFYPQSFSVVNGTMLNVTTVDVIKFSE